ncbi:MAG: hypothetical protein JRJ29_12900 [Deltaproteobacteria bacterium]|nr:hypothetical protein [Deltaproteobacteria bacterium]
MNGGFGGIVNKQDKGNERPGMVMLKMAAHGGSAGVNDVCLESRDRSASTNASLEQPAVSGSVARTLIQGGQWCLSRDWFPGRDRVVQFHLI